MRMESDDGQYIFQAVVLKVSIKALSLTCLQKITIHLFSKVLVMPELLRLLLFSL